MRLSLALGFVLLASLYVLPTYASRSGEHLELLSVDESTDEHGLAVFNGTIQNTHTIQSIEPYIYVILKKDGIIVARYLDHPIETWADGLGPGHSVNFSITTDYAPEDYDEFYVRLEGELMDVELDFIEGDLVIVEGSLTLTTGIFGFTEQTVFYGELVNNTNAVITGIRVEIDLMDARDNVIGSATSDALVIGFVNFLEFIELQPSEKIEFGALSTVSIGRIKEWDAKVYFRPIEIVDQAIPTVSTGVSWGQIKNHAAEEMGR